MATKDDVDYVVSEVPPPADASGPLRYFRVTKFSGDEPKGHYNVKYNPQTGYGRCDCPAAAYRNTGSGDKHVLMVKKHLSTIVQNPLIKL